MGLEAGRRPGYRFIDVPGHPGAAVVIRDRFPALDQMRHHDHEPRSWGKIQDHANRARATATQAVVAAKSSMRSSAARVRSSIKTMYESGVRSATERWLKANSAIRSTRTPENGAVFWSGYAMGNKDLAQEFARRVNGKTVEMTSAGKWLDQKWPYDKLQARIGALAAKNLWDDISTRFAYGASGEVNAFIQGMRGDTTFLEKTYMKIERPILVRAGTKVTKLIEHE